MKDTMKLHEICGYLPYGLKAEMLDYKSDYVGKQYDIIIGVHQWSKDGKDWSVLTCGGSKPNFTSIKPLLRPLSDLTKEIGHNSVSIQLEPKHNKVIPSELIYKYYFYTIREDGHFSYHIGDGTCIGRLYQGAPYGLIQLLIEWHFDIHGLIDRNLALNLNDYEI